MAEAARVTTYDPYGQKGRRSYYEGQYAAYSSERSSFMNHWRELAEYFRPRRMRQFVTDRNKGDRRNQKIIDATGTIASRAQQAGMHSGLTSPARPWFKLGTPDPDLAEFGPIKEWLHTVGMRMQIIFSTSNLYNSLPTVYGDMGLFGTAAMAMLADDADLLRCYTFPIGSYCLGLDRRGICSTFIREYQLSVEQVVSEFGGYDGQPAERGRPIEWRNISKTVRDAYEHGNYNLPVNLLWIVTPNHDVGRYDDRRGFPFTSCYLEIGGEDAEDRQKLLRESGFKTFPVFAPRWDITGEDSYGTDCPGMIALGDVKQLQSMQRKKALAIEKGVDPPLAGPTQLETGKVSLIPGDYTPVDEREGSGKLRAIHEIGLNLQHLTMDVGQVQSRISRAFYEDLFLMLSRFDETRGSQPVTAREIDERHEEKLLALGPVLERTNDELLNPIIDRAFELMLQRGLIPPAPPDLEGVDLKVEYISLMAQAQRLVGIAGQDRFLNTLLVAAPVFPEIKHKIRIFRLMENAADMLGVDPHAIVPDDVAEQGVQAEQQQLVAAQQAETAAKQAQAAKDAAAAPMTGDTALTALSRQMGLRD